MIEKKEYKKNGVYNKFEREEHIMIFDVLFVSS